MAKLTCLSPLKFYTDVKLQNRYRSFAYGHIAPLITSFNNISPFQFSLVYSGAFSKISEVFLYDANTNEQISGNLISQFFDNGLSTYNTSGIITVLFDGRLPLSNILKYEGQYYLSVSVLFNNSSEKVVCYSEVFCYTNNIDDCIKIEYWNPENSFNLKNGQIVFSNNFHFILYLKTELGKPEYSFEEEVTKRLGYSFIESQVSKKTYKFNCIVPEYLCDAMRIIRLCSNKKIYYKNEEYDALTFDMSVEWQEQGDLASVNCEFDVDNIIVNLGGYQHANYGGDFDSASYDESFNVE